MILVANHQDQKECDDALCDNMSESFHVGLIESSLCHREFIHESTESTSMLQGPDGPYSIILQERPRSGKSWVYRKLFVTCK